MNKTRVNEFPILIVEDSAEDFDTVREAALRIGVKNQLVHATDVDEARDVLMAAARGGSRFSFMLLDQSLPGMNGNSLLSELRAHPVFENLPIIILSGSTRSEDRDLCYNAGANAYHIKSVRFDENLATLEEIFRYWARLVVLPNGNSASVL
jgi:two-component system, chemotaxis family, chemotaxis protein CheY